MAKADSKQREAVLTAEKIQEKINEKLSAESTFFADKIHTKIHEKLRERVCCKMCAGVVFVGIVLASILLISLIVSRLIPVPTEKKCNMRCLLRETEWAKFTEEELTRLASKSPAHVLEALSSVYVERHAAAFAQAHKEHREMQRLQDAHERMAQQLQDVQAHWESMVNMDDSPEKVAALKAIIAKADDIEATAGEVANGRSYDEARLSNLTSEDLHEVRTCADVLKTVSTEPCSDDPGSATGFLRAIGVEKQVGVLEEPRREPPTWPINLNYPGLRSLDVEHGIHVVDNFLSPEQCAALTKKLTTVTAQNRSSLAHGSFAQLHSLSSARLLKQPIRTPKWMYNGMPGALMQLDIKEKEQKDCRPVGGEQTAEAWTEVMRPLFNDRGQDLEKCERNGFGNMQLYDAACPADTSVKDQVAQKLTLLTQASPARLQPLELRHYGRGDFDFDHYDVDAEHSNGKVAPLMTVIVYLTGVKGGGTYFPKLDLRVTPKVGRALIFPTLTMNLSVNPAALHAEEEVKRGDKWVLGTSVYLGPEDGWPHSCASSA